MGSPVRTLPLPAVLCWPERSPGRPQRTNNSTILRGGLLCQHLLKPWACWSRNTRGLVLDQWRPYPPREPTARPGAGGPGLTHLGGTIPANENQGNKESSVWDWLRRSSCWSLITWSDATARPSYTRLAHLQSEVILTPILNRISRNVFCWIKSSGSNLYFVAGVCILYCVLWIEMVLMHLL